MKDKKKYHFISIEEFEAIKDGRLEDIRPENIELCKEWLAELQGQVYITEESEVTDGQD